MSDLDTYLSFAKTVAREAGEVIRRGRKVAKMTKKADLTPVTDIDIAVNHLLIERVAQEFPSHGVLGEEVSWHADRDWLWVCDPIDGTFGFLTNVPTSTFSLALVKGGESIAAVVYNPWTDALYAAAKGQGAYCNDSKLKVSNRGQKKGGVVLVGGTGSSTAADRGVNNPAAIAALQKRNWKTVNTPGIAYKGALVAEGSLDVIVYPYTAAHDVAAIALLVTEAGGNVTDLSGVSQSLDRPVNGAVMSNGIVHEEMLKVLAELPRQKV